MLTLVGGVPTRAVAGGGIRGRGWGVARSRRRRRTSVARTGRGCRPSPSRAWGGPGDAEDVDGVDALRADRAQVGPGVAKVELVGELLPEAQAREADGAGVGGVGLVIPVRAFQSGAVGELELNEVGAVPAGERVVDRRGELGEGVAAGGGEDAARPRPERLSPTFDEVDLNRQPGARHDPMLTRTLRWVIASHIGVNLVYLSTYAALI